MIIKSAAGRAFAAVCLTAITTFSGAHAQMGPAPGSYWGPPGPPYMATPRAPTAPTAPHQAPTAPMAPHREPMPRGANMSHHRLEPA
jgi:hypothetical protein